MKFFYLLLASLTVFSISSCKPTLYAGSYGQINQTQVVLSNANFKVLGSFTGSVVVNKSVISVKDKGGLISLAKERLLKNAKDKGVELIGSRTLTNVSTDIIQNSNRIKVVVSAEIIEFTK
jgi:hypothetical protein